MKKTIDYILLILYTLCFYTLWQLCQWGGVRSHLKRLLPLVALLLIGIIIKLILRHRGFRAPYRRARITSCILRFPIMVSCPGRFRISFIIRRWSSHTAISTRMAWTASSPM